MNERRYNGYTLGFLEETTNLPAIFCAAPELVARIRELEAQIAALDGFLRADGSASVILANNAGRVAWELSVNDESVINESPDLWAALPAMRDAVKRWRAQP